MHRYPKSSEKLNCKKYNVFHKLIIIISLHFFHGKLYLPLLFYEVIQFFAFYEISPFLIITRKKFTRLFPLDSKEITIRVDQSRDSSRPLLRAIHEGILLHPSGI